MLNKNTGDSLLLSREWIQHRLQANSSVELFDGRFMMSDQARAQAIPAAVLIPLVNKPEGIQVLLTQRTTHLYHHAGQISFPGGRIDPEDGDTLITALRETEEEIGLGRDKVEILGALQEYFIPSGFKVSPWVGWVNPPFSLTPDPFEVDAIFEVPLSFFFDPKRHALTKDEFEGRSRQYYLFQYHDKTIWGATAGMLVNLYHTLFAELKNSA
ncbi:MAG: coenzyme A pyrophosphatase [Ferrovum sp. 37-45-19]|jgi:8-oxo-dGTP pyrophosphatase MutT (NUDIX family)|uniref:CoA pyrophosphatase n=1 Tax=Ferrovum sp. JA12 TaxID=1356299 RepID=UPI000702F36D|nr:CoA pyrophosphatase [Ferrovum sp. JA12]OYV80207.1 MAG: coenzyme A pyrophosphatase [Ferrovum sp. 21-44-67]OYV94484.1 MAG: coenzyme A pyrophosphatase [Ferrovum sp. 37-45-19]OZB33893.1 MAG: coenzyme A pyrophosphatase [Ferrovum sp. 34-44-207]HQT81618.1 CoA pyrophosphatase [Ferrovaceae bacterium]KRH78887.1 putative nudix hydrolase NudL [Ferrovum sp. JA12]